MTSIINAEASIWDMDGCKYRYPKEFAEIANRTAALALFECLGEEVPKNSFNEFVRQAGVSFKETGSPVLHFAEKYDIQHELLDAKRHELLPVDSIIPIHGLPRPLKSKVRSGHKTHLATHSNMHFTKRAIPHLGLSDIYNFKSNVITLDRYGHDFSKCKSPRLIIDSAENMGIDVSDTAFFEDTAKNFIPIKDHNHRVKTVLITWGRDVQKTSEIDFMFRDPLEAVKAIRPPERKAMVFMRPR